MVRVLEYTCSRSALRAATLEGTALHRGGTTRVTLRRAAGPVRFVSGRHETALDALALVRTDRGVAVRSRDGALEVDLVEHLLAAFGGLGIRDGVTIEVDGGELPLLDGGARAFADALLALEVAARPPSLVVARAGTVHIGASSYAFAPADATLLVADVTFRAPVGSQVAAWAGAPSDFLERIAPARTFGWRDELASLQAAGRARHVDLASVVVLDEAAPAPCEPTEPARHKLLDLIGDLALYGGPPRGRVVARLPGHTATHAAVTEALARGLLTRSQA